MFLVAVTGGISTGKSVAASVFKENGIKVIDADEIAREIVEPGKPAWKKIKEEFPGVINDDRFLNREALGKLIFNDKEKRKRLNEITHPVIHRKLFFQILKCFMSGSNYIALELPLLFETGLLLDFIYKIICVTCDEDTQIKRLMKRNNLTFDEANNRIKSQMPLNLKSEKSNFIIDNSGSETYIREEVNKIIKVLNSSNHHWVIRAYLAIGIIVLAVVVYCIYSLKF